jgi:hypothetical protein
MWAFCHLCNFCKEKDTNNKITKKKMRENATTRGLTVELVGFWTWNGPMFQPSLCATWFRINTEGCGPSLFCCGPGITRPCKIWPNPSAPDSGHRHARGKGSITGGSPARRRGSSTAGGRVHCSDGVDISVTWKCSDSNNKTNYISLRYSARRIY